MDTAAWKERQAELVEAAEKVPQVTEVPRLVAGVDCAFDKRRKLVFAAAVVWDRQTGEVVEKATATRPLDVPYVPGFLSFREGPAVHAALDGLATRVDLILFDGQGVAHPRRCGLATHVGAERQTAGVGVAKSRLIGTHADPAQARGGTADLTDRGDLVGRVVRTRDGVKPLYVSVGCGVSLDLAVEAVLSCHDGVRLPGPTRHADRLVAEAKAGRL